MQIIKVHGNYTSDMKNRNRDEVKILGSYREKMQGWSTTGRQSVNPEK